MNRFEHVINSGYEFDLTKFMSLGWESFKKEAGPFVAFIVIIFLATIAISLVSTTFFMSNWEVRLFLNLVSSIIQTALYAGAYVFLRGIQTRQASFGQFFEGFQMIGPISLYNIIFGLLYNLGMVFIFMAALSPISTEEVYQGLVDPTELVRRLVDSPDNLGVLVLAFGLFMIVVIIVSTLYSLTIPLIVDARLSLWDAMETSRKVVQQKFFQFFFAYILIGLIFIIGVVVTCGLGVVVLFPFLMATHFHMYDSILRPTGQSDLTSEIGTFGEVRKDSNTESEGDQK